MAPTPKKLLIFIALGVLLLAIGLFLKQEFFPEEFLYAGTIEAVKVDVPARLNSVIAKIHVRTGENVTAGERLLSLSCEEVRLENELVTLTFQRLKRLFRVGSVPAETYDQARNQKSLADLKLSWCEVKAPLTGTLLAHYHEEGEMVAAQSRLFTLADLGRVYAYIYVAHDEVARIRIHQNVTALLPELKGKEFPAVITEVGEEAEFTPKNVQTRNERQRLVYALKVEMDNPERILKPGMTVEVRLPETGPEASPHGK